MHVYGIQIKHGGSNLMAIPVQFNEYQKCNINAEQDNLLVQGVLALVRGHNLE